MISYNTIRTLIIPAVYSHYGSDRIKQANAALDLAASKVLEDCAAGMGYSEACMKRLGEILSCPASPQ